MSSMSTSTPIAVWGETYIRLYKMSLSWLSPIKDEVPIFDDLLNRVKGCPWCFNRIKRLPMPSHKYIEQQ